MSRRCNKACFDRVTYYSQIRGTQPRIALLTELSFNCKLKSNSRNQNLKILSYRKRTPKPNEKGGRTPPFRV